MNRHDRRATEAVSGQKGIIRHGGRSLTFTILVNTGRTAAEVAQAIKKAAAGPGQDMVVIVGGEMEPAAAQEAWREALQAAQEQRGPVQ